MNAWLLIAGILAGLAALIHTVAGERTDIRSLRASTVPLSEQAELRGVWHIASAVLALSAVVLLLLAAGMISEAPGPISRGIAVFYVIIGAVFGLTVLLTGRNLLLRAPQWALLWAIGVCAWLGAV